MAPIIGYIVCYSAADCCYDAYDWWLYCMQRWILLCYLLVAEYLLWAAKEVHLLLIMRCMGRYERYLPADRCVIGLSCKKNLFFVAPLAKGALICVARNLLWVPENLLGFWLNWRLICESGG